MLGRWTVLYAGLMLSWQAYSLSSIPSAIISTANTNVAFVCDRLQSSREDVSPAWDSKPEQKRLVDLVLGNGNGNSSSISREVIKKRLQRARKFLMIVELFGTTVLNAAPKVSVSRRVSFLSFTLGFVDGVFIFMRIPSKPGKKSKA
jgi:hypothetical protein